MIVCFIGMRIVIRRMFVGDNCASQQNEHITRCYTRFVKNGFPFHTRVGRLIQNVKLVVLLYCHDLIAVEKD